MICWHRWHVRDDSYVVPYLKSRQCTVAATNLRHRWHIKYRVSMSCHCILPNLFPNRMGNVRWHNVGLSCHTTAHCLLLFSQLLRLECLIRRHPWGGECFYVFLFCWNEPLEIWPTLWPTRLWGLGKNNLQWLWVGILGLTSPNKQVFLTSKECSAQS